jgi:hypothetical protein
VRERIPDIRIACYEIRLPNDPHRALVDEAGKLYVLRRELRALKKRRDEIEATIRRLERQVAEADAAVASKLARAKAGRGRGIQLAGASPLTPGKLPHRVLAHMMREPTRIYSAGEIRASLGVPDVQQVRTALARLVDKGHVRRLGERGEFTLPQQPAGAFGPAIFSGDDGLKDAQQIGDRRIADEAEQ